MISEKNDIYKKNGDVTDSNHIRTQGARLMNVDQVAIYTGLKIRTIRNYVYTGQIPYIKINKMVRFDKAKIDKWIDEFYCSEP